MTQRSYSMADAYNSIYSQPTKSVSLREALDILDEEDVEYILDKLKEKGFTEGLSIEDQMRISKCSYTTSLLKRGRKPTKQ